MPDPLKKVGKNNYRTLFNGENNMYKVVLALYTKQ